MKNAIILHGCPEKENYYRPDLPSESNAHWLPWLQHELIIRDIAADTPDIPHSYEPVWETWVREVERYDITEETILVGHSAGAGFWVKYLSVHPELRVGKVVLVGPWFDPDKTIRDENFFSFTLDSTLVDRTAGVEVFYSVDDSESSQLGTQFLKQNLPSARFREFPAGYGHFTYENLQTDAFPELRDAILSS